MRALRLLPLLLLLAPAGLAGPGSDEGVVANKELNFEIAVPKTSIDWEIVKIDGGRSKQGWKAHLQSLYADSDPPAVADVLVYCVPLNKDLAKKDLKTIAIDWREGFEAGLSSIGDRRKGAPAKLAGVEAYRVDVTGEWVSGVAKRSYTLAKNGNYMYAVYVNRTYDAADDEDLDEEIKEIEGSFKFYEIQKPKAHKKGGRDGGGPDVGKGNQGPEEDIDPNLIKRKKIKNLFWKFECVKPAGLIQLKTDTFDEAEKANGLVLKFNRDRNQSRLLVRLYCKSLKSGQRVNTLDQNRDVLIKQFEETYEEKKRLEPVIEKWKLKGAKKSMHLKLTGKRTTTEVTHWYMADCKNGRQYRLYVYVSGTTGEKEWGEQIKDLLKNFKVLK